LALLVRSHWVRSLPGPDWISIILSSFGDVMLGAQRHSPPPPGTRPGGGRVGRSGLEDGEAGGDAGLVGGTAVLDALPVASAVRGLIAQVVLVPFPAVAEAAGIVRVEVGELAESFGVRLDAAGEVEPDGIGCDGADEAGEAGAILVERSSEGVVQPSPGR